MDMRTKVTWDMMQNVEEMLDIAEETTEDNVSGYLRYEKSIWGFRSIFLMSDEYTYYNERGEFDTFKVDENLYERMLRGEHIHSVGSNSEGEDIIYYMRTVKPVKYKDITVSSVGISFKIEDLIREMDMAALEKEGQCYLINPKNQGIVYTNNENAGQMII